LSADPLSGCSLLYERCVSACRSSETSWKRTRSVRCSFWIGSSA
jgi:hypothetical protein